MPPADIEKTIGGYLGFWREAPGFFLEATRAWRVTALGRLAPHRRMYIIMTETACRDCGNERESPLDLASLYLQHLSPSLQAIREQCHASSHSYCCSLHLDCNLRVLLTVTTEKRPCLHVASGPSRPIFQSSHGRAQPCSPACPALASPSSSASQSELSSSCPPWFPTRVEHLPRRRFITPVPLHVTSSDHFFPLENAPMIP